MSVYFVYRGNDAGPACKHLRRFEADSILDVFRAHWGPLVDPEESEAELWRYGSNVFGPGYSCLSGLASAIAENAWPAPKSVQDLHGRWEWLANEGWISGLSLGPHHLAILDTNDVYEFALYIFDERYAAEHPDRVAFLLRDRWQLPAGEARGPFEPAVDCLRTPQTLQRAGCTFVAFLGVEDHYGLTNLGTGVEQPLRIDGLRLPDLPRYLFTVPGGEAGENYPPAIRCLAEGLRHFAAGLAGDERPLVDAVRANPAEELAWTAYSEWLEQRGEKTAGMRMTAELRRRCPPSLWYHAGSRPEDMVVAHTHVAQASKRLNGDRENADFHHIILFDNRWAAAHRDLANSVLRFGARWDFL